MLPDLTPEYAGPGGTHASRGRLCRAWPGAAHELFAVLGRRERHPARRRLLVLLVAATGGYRT